MRYIEALKQCNYFKSLWVLGREGFNAKERKGHCLKEDGDKRRREKKYRKGIKEEMPTEKERERERKRRIEKNMFHCLSRSNIRVSFISVSLVGQ